MAFAAGRSSLAGQALSPNTPPGNGDQMCNHEVLDAIRERMEKLIVHTGSLRNRFHDVQTEFNEGNLDRSTLDELNQAVHEMEADAAAFEKLMEGSA